MIPFDGPEELWNMAAVYREAYTTTKYRVAERFQPKKICEIGFYSGIAAECFLWACPEAEYYGIDNLSSERSRGIEVVVPAAKRLRGLGYNVAVEIADSQLLSALSYAPYDLIHVDGDHSRAGACHDVELAWHACAPDGVILVDNGHDTDVVAGTFDALSECNPGVLSWEYLHEGVGSILIHRSLK